MERQIGIAAIGKATFRLAGLLGLLAASPLAPAASQATTPLDSVSVSPDVTTDLDATFDDDEVGADNLLGVAAPVALGALPAEADVSAYHLLANGDRLFSLDVTAALAGPLTVHPGDVVRYDGSYAIEFDAAAEGIPAGVNTDAVSQDTVGDLLLSFDTTVDLGAITAADHDVVAWNGNSFSVAFDGSAAGVPEALDVDAVHALSGGKFGLSFDGSGQLGAVAFDDEDVLEYDPGGPTWNMAYDGSTEHVGWSGGPDLDAVALPEPSRVLLLGSGIAGLLGIGLRTTRCERRGAP